MADSGRGSPRDHGSALGEVLRTLWREIPGDHLSMVAAGLAYYGVFGLLPALAAAAAIWGQIGDLSSLQHSVESGRDVLPNQARGLLEQFVTSVPEGFGGGLSLLLTLGVVVLSSYRAASGLITALNIVFDTTETRGWFRRAVTALVVGVSGITLLFAALVVMTVPPLLGPHLSASLEQILLWGRWPTLFVAFALGLGMLFSYAPSRARPRWRLVSWGAAAATILWVAVSFGVSFYTAHIASYGQLYGSLGAIAVLLLWFYLSAAAVLAGAEIDAVLAARKPGPVRGSCEADPPLEARA